MNLIRIDTSEDKLQEEIREFDTDHITHQRDKRDQYNLQLARLGGNIKERKADQEQLVSQQDHIATLISKSAGGQGQKSSIRVGMYQDLEAIFTKAIDQLRDGLREDVERHATSAFPSRRRGRH